jgi:uncharacterized protein with von Willebrand factor type A (vWA) domain
MPQGAQSRKPTPHYELFIRSGLAKSAFNDQIYDPFDWTFYVPYATELQRMLREYRVWPHFYQLMDAFQMFYQPFQKVAQSLKQFNKVAPVWWWVVKSTLFSEKFMDLNKFTSGSVDLSLIAAYQFLRNIFNVWDRNIDKIQEQLRSDLKDKPTGVCKGITDSTVNGTGLGDVITQAIEEVKNTVQEFNNARTDATEAIQSLSGLPGGSGYSLDALSALTFLNNPDEFRRRVTILKWSSIMLKHFTNTLPRSFEREVITSQWGGVAGVTLGSKIADTLPSELALASHEDPGIAQVGRALLAQKLVTSSLQVLARATAVEPVIFIDKSGSMAEGIRFGSENVPKISVASGLALALYKKFQSPVYLFDTELSKASASDVVRMLLTISADGGTDITPVLEEIIHLGQDKYFIILSDGITEASEDVLKRFESLAPRTLLVMVGEEAPRYNWVEVLRRFGNVVEARDVATIEAGVRGFLDRH